MTIFEGIVIFNTLLLIYLVSRRREADKEPIKPTGKPLEDYKFTFEEVGNVKRKKATKSKNGAKGKDAPKKDKKPRKTAKKTYNTPVKKASRQTTQPSNKISVRREKGRRTRS